MPSPTCFNYEMYEFVGRMMTGAILSEENIVVNLAPFFWQKIGGAPASLAMYIEGVDLSLESVKEMLTYDGETFEAIFGGCQGFEFQSGDNERTVELEAG